MIRPRQRRSRLVLSLLVAAVWGMPGEASGGSIDTSRLEQPWPKRLVRETEVSRYAVQWYQRLDRAEGLIFGVRFTTPTDRQTTWTLATDFKGVGRLTPGVTAVRYLEQTPTRQVIQIDVRVLWKSIQLNFEIEQEPPDVLRFRLVNELLGEYRGVMRLQDPSGEARSSEPAHTQVEMSTWLKPAVPVPLTLLAVVERIVLLQGTREFLETCERTFEGDASQGDAGL